MSRKDPNTIGPSTRKRPGKRRDAVRNRQRLLEAVREVLRTDPSALNMQAVADFAGLSVATAYRYFPSLDDLIVSYMGGVIVDLRDYSHDCPKTGAALFEDVVARWVEQLRLNGPALAQLRSRQGLLSRLASRDALSMSVRDAWERPIRGVLRELNIPDEHFNYALFLYNVLFDPREVTDLVDSGLAETEVVARLVAAYYGAISGWATIDSQ